MKNNYDEALVTIFEEEFRKGFSLLLETYPEEHFYYFTCILDEGMKPYISAFSYEALEKILEQYQVIEEEKLWYKWGCCESPYVGFGYEECFREHDAFLDEREQAVQDNDAAFDHEFDLRVGSMEEAMRRLDASGLFGTGEDRKHIVITAEIMPPEAYNKEAAERLNPETDISEFLENCGE